MGVSMSCRTRKIAPNSLSASDSFPISEYRRLRYWHVLNALAGSVDMKPLFDSDVTKGAFFISTLPESLDNFMDNLNTKGISSFSEILDPLQDIIDKNALKDPMVTALHAATSKRKHFRPTATSSDEYCTFCKSRGFPYKGHSHRNCRRLGKAKKDRANRGFKRHQGVKQSSTSPKDNAYKASAQEAVALITFSDATNTAYLGKVPPPQPARYLDTAASKHMSGVIEDFE
ncbi:hypothetical protein K470DRAFT_260950 [Piedraia hortae CBS 480.64]|uniref:Uncharacterized protein n=1 Tax=Piedraia hortae CBS 480.64 TaxID=1314780 RepID=A0A6A7BPS6_9PEZI|nr:hypothetical protein K470DRAFT_260950 [Piedraia hortae CBS 480.64]